MPEFLVVPLTIATAVTTALIGGVFFIFSITIMQAFGRIPMASGIAAMQEINIVIVKSLFLPVFFGAALTSLILAGYALLNWQRPGASWLLAGGLIYVVGSIVLTVVRNVPLNDELAAVTAASPQGADVWARYLVDWTMWNHIRTVACIGASACFIMALVRRLST